MNVTRTGKRFASPDGHIRATHIMEQIASNSNTPTGGYLCYIADEQIMTELHTWALSLAKGLIIEAVHIGSGIAFRFADAHTARECYNLFGRPL